MTGAPKSPDIERGPRAPAWAGVFASRLQRLQLWLAGAALAVMMTVTVANVFMRYLFNKPIPGSYELVEASLVLVVFHGLASVFISRRNIVIDLVDTLTARRPRLARLLMHLADLTSLGVLVVVLWAMTQPARQAFDYGDVKLELGLPVYILWIFAMTGLAGTIVCAGTAAFENGAPRPGASAR